MDPPLLLGGGYALGRHIDEPGLSRGATVAMTAAVLGLSLATYHELPVMRRVWEGLGSRSGRDLILNSWGALSFDPSASSARRRTVVGGLFALYPVWALAGHSAGRRRRRTA